MTLPKIKFHRVVIGCDPEFFFKDKNGVVGAEKILPLSGLEYKPGELGRSDAGVDAVGNFHSRIIIDGVQAELNPRPAICRVAIGREIACCFEKVVAHMKKSGDTKIDFKQTIELSKDDMEKLSDDSKKFGCMPSKNANNGGKMGKITVDPMTYAYRSAGGHIHLGGYNKETTKAIAQHERLVRVLDIILGNTCVLIDRDPGAVTRRKVYGQAGEFRTPPHGLEYRTLSNFWLRSYPLMSFVMGMARTAVLIVANNLDEEFVNRVNLDEVSKAINRNDYDLALKNFKKIEELLMEITPVDSEFFDLTSENIKEFRHFVKKGIDYWFPGDAVDYWLNLTDNAVGFGKFLDTVVRKDMNKNG